MRINETINAPFPSCLHPQKITNSRGEEILVPCGKCKACMINKCNEHTQAITLEASEHIQTFFVTLTYNEDYIPRVNYYSRYGSELVFEMKRNKFVKTDKEDEQKRLNENYDKAIAVVRYHSKNQMLKKINDLNFLCKNKFENDNIPVLYKQDLQRFLKRLRKNLNKYNYGKMRYFACGEYGPKHYRPHYHLLLWFETPQKDLYNYTRRTQGRDRKFTTSLVLDKAIRESWKYGDTCSEISKGFCASYVAGYTSSYSSVPSVLRQISFKPFSTHSVRLGGDFFKARRSQIYQNRGFDDIVIKRGNNYFNVIPSKSVQNSIFPKCFGYGLLNDEMCLSLYTIYGKLIRNLKFEEEKKISSLAKDICTDLFNFEYFGSKNTKERRKIVRSLTSVPTDYNSFVRFLYKYFVCNNMILNHIEDYERMYGFVTRILYTSKKFIKICFEENFTEIQFFNIIKDYYNKIALRSLASFYGYLENETDETIIKQCYNDNFNFEIFKETQNYRYYSQRIDEKFEDKIKHKKINDLNTKYNKL